MSVQHAYGSTDLPSETQFRQWAQLALAHAEPKPRQQQAELAIRLVGTEESAQLNAAFRDKVGPTNVLAFPLDSELDEFQGTLMGDIVICSPLVRDEARQQCKSEVAHYAHLLIHAILHLLGHDHHHPAEAEAMEGLETKILAHLGFPDPYCEVT